MENKMQNIHNKNNSILTEIELNLLLKIINKYSNQHPYITSDNLEDFNILHLQTLLRINKSVICDNLTKFGNETFKSILDVFDVKTDNSEKRKSILQKIADKHGYKKI